MPRCHRCEVIVMGHILLSLISVIFLSLLESRTSLADYYKYVDKQGITYFVDSPGKIPIEYRKDLEAQPYQQHDPLSSAARQRLLEQEKQRRETMIQEYTASDLETKVTIINNRVLVPVRLSYRGREIERTLLLDTGATTSLLSEESAQSLGVLSFRQGRGQVADGTVIDTKIVTLDYIAIGPHKKVNVEVAFIKPKGEKRLQDGLLGMNFLRGLEYTVDFEKNLIRWKKP